MELKNDFSMDSKTQAIENGNYSTNVNDFSKNYKMRNLMKKNQTILEIWNSLERFRKNDFLEYEIIFKIKFVDNILSPCYSKKRLYWNEIIFTHNGMEIVSLDKNGFHPISEKQNSLQVENDLLKSQSDLLKSQNDLLKSQNDFLCQLSSALDRIEMELTMIREQMENDFKMKQTLEYIWPIGKEDALYCLPFNKNDFNPFEIDCTLNHLSSGNRMSKNDREIVSQAQDFMRLLTEKYSQKPIKMIFKSESNFDRGILNHLNKSFKKDEKQFEISRDEKNDFIQLQFLNGTILIDSYFLQFQKSNEKYKVHLLQCSEDGINWTDITIQSISKNSKIENDFSNNLDKEMISSFWKISEKVSNPISFIRIRPLTRKNQNDLSERKSNVLHFEFYGYYIPK
jgi:hypothetical protein